MVILVILLLLLGGYSFYLIKKLDKETNIRLKNIKFILHELDKKDLYLLSELDSKIKTNEESLLKKLKEINNQNQKDNNIKHEQLISNEFKKLRSDINKDLDDIVESVKSIKVF
tara:strand:- start:352 stop:693 length:342 start_codon:yes stop_codon:yes gene_type:complete